MKRSKIVQWATVFPAVCINLILGGCNVEQVPLRFDAATGRSDASNGPMDSQIASDAAVASDVATGPLDALSTPPDVGSLTDAGLMGDATSTPTDAQPTDATSTDASATDASATDANPAQDAQFDAGLINMDGGGMMACVGPDPRMNAPPPEAIPDGTCMNCTDAPTPTWRLADFQDNSCGSGQTYGLESFSGTATLVALFNAGCGYCQSQARNLERMRLELDVMGVDAHFSAINGAPYAVHQDRMLDLCAFPFFQDTEMDDAMGGMNGSIYDIFVYRPDGTLHVFLDNAGNIDTYMAEEAGYENVKEALLSAIRGEAYVAPFPPVEIVIPDAGLKDNPDQGK
jgi:hypothetical protein